MQEKDKMKHIKADYVIVTKDNIVTSIGKSSIRQEKILWNGKGIKWLDDKASLKHNFRQNDLSNP